MQIIVHDSITVYDPTEEMLSYIKNTLYAENPEFAVRTKLGKWTGRTEPYIYFYSAKEKYGHIFVTVPFGCLQLIFPYLTKDCKFQFRLSPDRKLDYPGVDMPLYDYQKEAVARLVSQDGALVSAGNIISKGGILIGKCGSGKTQVGIGAIVALKRKALWLTHTLDLVQQAYDRAAMYMPKEWLGKIASGKVNIGSHITFATVQTMSKLDLSKYRMEWDVIIVDECHRICGSESQTRMFFGVLSSLAARYKFGLTATLHRSDGLTQSATYALGPVLYEISKKDLESKLITPYVKVIETDLPESEMYIDGGDIEFSKLIGYIAGNTERNLLIAKMIEADYSLHSTLILSDRISQLESIKGMLPAKVKEKSVMIDGTMQSKKMKKVRQDAISMMKSGEKLILFATYGLAREGLDIPRLDRLYLASPKKDAAVVEQSLGRISRTAPGKNSAMCIDFVDKNIGICRGLFYKRLATYNEMDVGHTPCAF